jgi:hypothetical protein
LYRAPTWSLASIDGAVNYPFDYDDNIAEDYKRACDVIDISTTLTAPNMPYGQVIDGYVKVRGTSREG